MAYIKKWGGPIYFEVNSYGIKKFASLYDYKIDGNYLKEFGGKILYKIDGFLSHKQLMAILAILFE